MQNGLHPARHPIAHPPPSPPALRPSRAACRTARDARAAWFKRLGVVFSMWRWTELDGIQPGVLARSASIDTMRSSPLVL